MAFWKNRVIPPESCRRTGCAGPAIQAAGQKLSTMWWFAFSGRNSGIMPALRAPNVKAVGCRRTVSAIGLCDRKLYLSYEMSQQNVSTHIGLSCPAAGYATRYILEKRT